MLIRRESPADIATVRAVTASAFHGAPYSRFVDGEPIEAVLLDRLRDDPGWLPSLSLVADDGGHADGMVVGHVVCTRGHVEDRPVVALGPISVRPDRQRAGVGQALVHTVLGAADALGEPLVVLLGDPAFYGRFGFRPASELGIASPDPAWGAGFQVRPLSAWTSDLTGAFRYAAPFEEL